MTVRFVYGQKTRVIITAIAAFLFFAGMAFSQEVPQERDKPSISVEYNLYSSFVESPDNPPGADVILGDRERSTRPMTFSFNTGITPAWAVNTRFGISGFNVDGDNLLGEVDDTGKLIDMEASAVYKRHPNLKIKAGLSYLGYKSDYTGTSFLYEYDSSLIGPVVGAIGEHNFSRIRLQGHVDMYPYMLRRDRYFYTPIDYTNRGKTTAIGYGFGGTVGVKVMRNLEIYGKYKTVNYLMSDVSPVRFVTNKTVPGTLNVRGLVMGANISFN